MSEIMNIRAMIEPDTTPEARSLATLYDAHESVKPETVTMASFHPQRVDTPFEHLKSESDFEASTTPDDKQPRGHAVKGRSFGDHSSQPIKNMRAKASNGDIEAALKLGWGVARLTEIFNQHKASRGEHVEPDQPIDDPHLLARIEERHKAGSQAAKRRAALLRAKAEAGDIEAARKLKYSAKRIAAMFPLHQRTSSEPVIDTAAAKAVATPHTATPMSQHAASSPGPQPYPMPFDIEQRLRDASEAELIAQNNAIEAIRVHKAAQQTARSLRQLLEPARDDQRASCPASRQGQATIVRPRKGANWKNRRSNFEVDASGED